MDKIKYEPSDAHPDPSYEKKNSSLFWRGGTSEGVSVDGSWKGMGRQRLAWLAKSTTHHPGRIPKTNPLLAPKEPGNNRGAWKMMDTAVNHAEMPTMDVRIVEKINRCVGDDCAEQERLFAPLSPHVDFQDHWRYKYLFDLDGAGFSGRFIPFLQSRSLPFKMAMFREWYDDRLTPWLHFVPQDPRLHGLYATLTYFAGLSTGTTARMVRRDDDGGDGGGDGGGARADDGIGGDSTGGAENNEEGRTGDERGDVLIEAHDREGEFIANEGRRWANKALRKEDMEIYMFRLLLEWGRLTDDKRDDLGFWT